MDEGVTGEARAGSCTGTANGREQVTVKDAALDEAFGERRGEAVLPQFFFSALFAGDELTVWAVRPSGSVVVDIGGR